MTDPSQPERLEARSILVANETRKLTATYVNGVAIAVLAVGGLAAVFSQRAVSPVDTTAACWAAAISILCLRVSAGLPWAARSFLKELR